jgi:hypothetical protein
MMLSTAQALKEWNSIPKLLAVVKTYAAAHPDQPTLPGELESQLGKSADALLKPLSSPHATWKQLLKNKVSKMTRMAPCVDVHAAWRHHCFRTVVPQATKSKALPRWRTSKHAQKDLS